jgi:acyl-coenzyme A synthetase/AMP-(fatty) acid ligase
LAAKLFYKHSDKVLLYTTFNHVGVISTQLVPAMIAGASIIGHYDFSGESVLEKLIRYRPNKTIIFPLGLSQMMRLPDWESIKLDFIEEVICGGQLINKEFVNELFAKGVSSVHNIYGSSEALPPVLVSTVTSSNVESCYNSTDSVALGLPVGDWKVKIIDRILCVQGRGLASANWINERFNDGYYSTGDRATFENNQYWTSGRADKMVRRRDVLVNASATERDLESIPGIREAIYYVADNDQLIIGLKFSSHLSQAEQDTLVTHVRNTLHPDKIHRLKSKNNFESIKGLTAFGDEL